MYKDYVERKKKKKKKGLFLTFFVLNGIAKLGAIRSVVMVMTS
jgi:hypothetical protein